MRPNDELIFQFCKEFHRITSFEVIVVDPDGTQEGEAIHPEPPGKRVQAVQEALRWGESCVMMDGNGLVPWAIPWMINSKVIGGLVVEGVSISEEPMNGSMMRRIRIGCAELLRLAQEYNLTNADCLAWHRAESRRERERAEARKSKDPLIISVEWKNAIFDSKVSPAGST